MRARPLSDILGAELTDFDMTRAQLFAFDPQSCRFNKVDIGDIPPAAVSALDCDQASVRTKLGKFAELAKAGF